MANKDEITIVFGMNRAGGSLIMQLLEKAGVPLFISPNGISDEGNMNGYYMHGRSKNIPANPKVLESVVGKAIRLYPIWMSNLPDTYHYKVIHVQRDHEEVWRSRQKQHFRKGKVKDENVYPTVAIEKMYSRQDKARNYLNGLSDCTILDVNYNTILEQPVAECQKIIDFLGLKADPNIMATIVDPALNHIEKGLPFIQVNRSPDELVPILNEHAKDKVYCEVGIGEGHLLNQVTTAKSKFGIESFPYGVQRCAELFPDIKVHGGDAMNIIPKVSFEVCYMWIVFPFCRNIVMKILEEYDDVKIIAGINYYYHLKKGDELYDKYVKLYTDQADPDLWNVKAKEMKAELEEMGMQVELHQVEIKNDFVFSYYIIQK